MMDDLISLEPKKRCEEYLRKQNIIFKKNVVFESRINPITILDFIIPGAVIITRNNFIKKSFYNIVLKVNAKIPKNFIFYIYIENLTEYNNYRELLMYQLNIKVINSFIEIKKSEIDYFIFDPIIIRCLCSENCKEYKNKMKNYRGSNLYCDQQTLDLALVKMDDEEYNNLNNINLKILDKVPTPVCVISGKDTIKLREDSLLRLDPIFEVFKEKFEYIKLKNEHIYRIIPGTTFLCPDCKRIVWTIFEVNGKCNKCTNKRKRIVDINFPFTFSFNSTVIKR